MTSAARRERNVKLPRGSGHVAIEDLVAQLRVIAQTLSGDLNLLALEVRLMRHHGGAAIPSSIANTAHALRRGEFARDKVS